LVRLVPGDHFDRISVFFLQEQIAPAQRAQAGSRWYRAIQFPVQQSAFCFALLHGALGYLVPEDFRTRSSNKVTVGAPFLQSRRHPCSLAAPDPYRRGPAAGVGKTSLESLKRNFMWPTIGAVVVAIFFDGHAAELGIGVWP